MLMPPTVLPGVVLPGQVLGRLARDGLRRPVAVEDLVVRAARHPGEVVRAREGHGHLAAVPAGRVGLRGRAAADHGGGPVDLEAALGRLRDVAGLVGDGHLARAEVVALARHDAVGRVGRRVDARQVVVGGPVDRDVVLVPAGGVGGRGRGAARASGRSCRC